LIQMSRNQSNIGNHQEAILTAVKGLRVWHQNAYRSGFTALKRKYV
jgi:hypothetical protein